MPRRGEQAPPGLARVCAWGGLHGRRCYRPCTRRHRPVGARTLPRRSHRLLAAPTRQDDEMSTSPQATCSLVKQEVFSGVHQKDLCTCPDAHNNASGQKHRRPGNGRALPWNAQLSTAPTRWPPSPAPARTAGASRSTCWASRRAAGGDRAGRAGGAGEAAPRMLLLAGRPAAHPAHARRALAPRASEPAAATTRRRSSSASTRCSPSCWRPAAPLVARLRAAPPRARRAAARADGQLAPARRRRRTSRRACSAAS